MGLCSCSLQLALPACSEPHSARVSGGSLCDLTTVLLLSTGRAAMPDLGGSRVPVLNCSLGDLNCSLLWLGQITHIPQRRWEPSRMLSSARPTRRGLSRKSGAELVCMLAAVVDPGPAAQLSVWCSVFSDTAGVIGANLACWRRKRTICSALRTFTGRRRLYRSALSTAEPMGHFTFHFMCCIAIIAMGRP